MVLVAAGFCVGVVLVVIASPLSVAVGSYLGVVGGLEDSVAFSASDG